jgi:hypothetical protein
MYRIYTASGPKIGVRFVTLVGKHSLGLDLRFGLLLKPGDHRRDGQVFEPRLARCLRRLVQRFERREHEARPETPEIVIRGILDCGVGFDPVHDRGGLEIGDRGLGFAGNLFERSQGINRHTGIESAVGRQKGRINGSAFIEGKKFGGRVHHQRPCSDTDSPNSKPDRALSPVILTRT